MLSHVKIRFLLSIFFLSFLASVLSACSSPLAPKLEDPEPEQKNVGLIYGYIDMDKALSSAYDWIIARRYRPSVKDLEMHVYRSGLFYHIGVEPGSYQVVRLGSKTLGRSFGVFHKNQTAIKVNKPGLYYMGTFLYSVPGDGTFNIKKVTSPSEKQVLTMLLKIMEDDYSEYKTQIAWIKNRLKQL